MLIKTRRDFLKAAVTSAGALGAFAKFGELNALAATGPAPYQALVCIFLNGGNDGHNTVIPIDSANYSLYSKARQMLAIPQGELMPIANGSAAYGLHPLMPEIAALYNAGNAAVIANVGMLVQQPPAGVTTKQIFQSQNLALLPPQLFSHSDQANQWQAAIPSGTVSTGWGGRVEDALFSQYNSAENFTSVTATAGCNLFCTGQQTFAETVPVGGASLLQGAITPARLAAVQQLMQFDNGLKLVTAANANFNRGVGFSTALTNALKGVVLNTVFPGTQLGQQLQTVAQIMKIRAALGIGRQVFYCELDGFDTHGAQSNVANNNDLTVGQDPLLQQLSQAVGAFYAATQEVGTDANTVTFTASEFGRTLQPNGSIGTDHAWGNHHFVIGTGAAQGGSLQGGRFWGQYPSLVLGGPDDANTRGTLVPTTSVDQYAATMAQWFGVPAGSLASIFPNVVNFQTSNLGFLG
jgi:uncharacterized protein (DUF1501 family)